MAAALRNISTILVVSAALFWASRVYEGALRDVRYFDGWILAACIAAQLLFHTRRHYPALSFGPAQRWLQGHVVVGYIAIVAFALHTGASLPDAPFEWVLWGAFLLVALSGIVGMWLTWRLPRQLRRSGEPVPFEQIAVRRHGLERDVETLVLKSVEDGGPSAISEFYVDRLQAFFAQHRNVRAHWSGSKQHLTDLFAEFDRIGAYLDDTGRDLLAKLRTRVVEKDRLDHQYTLMGVLQLWLFVHVPATYALVPLMLFHIVAAYAFSAGVP